MEARSLPRRRRDRGDRRVPPPSARRRAPRGTVVIMLHKTTREIEPAAETHTEFTLFNKILQTQINFPRPVFIVSSISREVTSAMID